MLTRLFGWLRPLRSVSPTRTNGGGITETDVTVLLAHPQVQRDITLLCDAAMNPPA